MRKIEKIIWSQDAFFKTEPRKSGETSINLSNEIFDFLGSVENGYITFKIYKEDYLKALCSLSLLLPLYTSSSKEATLKQYSNKFFDDCYKLILKKFGDSDSVNYKVHSLKREDGRIYLNELKESETGFNIRYFFVQSHSVVTFVQKDDGSYDLRFRNSLSELSKDQISDTEEDEDPLEIPESYRPILTAIRTKPFLLLAGISGTGKSRIVRELARACWDEGSEEYKAHKPRNFEMVQVKPNWHDSTDLIGFVSRSSGTPVFVVGDFLKFVVKAWEEPDVPYFLCLDEMNLAPVEQYFAEFLSVIESRKLYADGKIETDPILKPDYDGFNVKDGTPILSNWYNKLIEHLLSGCPVDKHFALKTQFESEGISIPKNLIVIGTVNMDETTFSFSRKVLDRAMTIEMNEVDLKAGLYSKYESIGKIDFQTIVGDAVEGVDVYETYKDVCDKVLDYLQKVNDVLDGTPFKVAYRTRNEFLLYVVNNLPYNKDNNNNELSQDNVINRALDEITCMKILPRIEGDVDKTSGVLNGLEDVLKGRFNEQDSASLKKIKEMKNRLQSGFTSFWS